jgi:hypothetical protein
MPIPITCGVTNASDTERTFPNAEYLIGESELNFWMQSQRSLESHAVWGDVYRQNMKTLAAIKDRIRTVKPENEVVSGIAAITTPRHTSLQIASGSNQLLCTADVVGSRGSPSGPPTCTASSTWMLIKARGLAEPSWIDVRVRR